MRCRWDIPVLAAAALTAVAASPALADWQYTAWNMSPAQVVAASDRIARQNSDRALDAAGLKARLTAPFEAESLPFTAVFLFDGRDRLRSVTLNPADVTSCPAIRDRLAAHHGDPEQQTDMVHASAERWDDVESDNLVVFLDLGHGNCSIQYSKLPNTRPHGGGQ